jgi:Alba
MASPATGATDSRPMSNSPHAVTAAANGVVATDGTTTTDSSRQDRPRNRIQVSREKRPLNFFVGLAKKFLVNENEVELSGLGLAVTTVVTVAEILKSSGHVEITRTIFRLPACCLASCGADQPCHSFSHFRVGIYLLL